MRRISQFLPPFILAWLITFSLASGFQSQFSVMDLIDAGINVSVTDRISMMASDWLGLLPIYGSLIAIFSLGMFLVINLLVNKLSIEHRFTLVSVYAFSGTLTMCAILFLLSPYLDASLQADLSSIGFYLQLAAGFVGGAFFALRYQSIKAPE